MRKFQSQEEKKLISAQRAGIKEAARKAKKAPKKSKEEIESLYDFIFNKSKSNGVTCGAPIGAPMETISNNKKSNGVWAKQDSSEYTDIEIRKARGLSNRIEGVDYSIREVQGVKVKRCSCCNQTWNINNFSKDIHTKDKIKNTCKDCNKKADSVRVYIPTSERASA